MGKHFLLYSIPVISLLFLSIFAFSISLPDANPGIKSVDSLEYTGAVCTTVKRADGTVEPTKCDHNVLLSYGRNMTRNCLTAGECAAITNITLCNANSSGGCATPTAGGTEAWNISTNCGMGGGAGTVVDYGIQGNYSISKTFTSTCSGVITNVTRLGNATNYFAANAFDTVTLNAADQITINWTVGIS